MVSALLGCAASREAGPGIAEPVEQEPAPAASVPEAYRPALEALEEAIREGSNDRARALFRRLELRLEADPAAEQALAAVLAGYDLVLGGRERTAALDLSLQLERISGDREAQVEVWLVARSRWSQELLLLPGALVLSVLRTEMDPRGRSGDRAVLLERDPKTELRVPAGGSARWSLGRLPSGVAGGSLASRLRVDLRARAARIKEAGREYPAEALAARPSRHVELAGYLPSSATPLEELRRAALAPEVGIDSWAERIVRLAPQDYEEASIGLRRLVAERATDLEILDRLAPALRWLLEGEAPGASPSEWRAWARASARTAQEAPRTLDLPGA
ncbi:MAG: hypothetical protein ISQ08_07005 [Planctomycetes bacterium]|nr:hypothetical protein [Planctomycetota bacterium]